MRDARQGPGFSVPKRDERSSRRAILNSQDGYAFLHVSSHVAGSGVNVSYKPSY